MKTTQFLSVLALSSIALMNAQKQEDIKAIKAMTGCYEVSFNFAETFPTNKEYEKAKNYRSGALEWITVADESSKKIQLQHLLIVNPAGKDKNAIVKHWRQDWIYENTDLYVFDKGNQWKFKKLDPKDVKGQWTQVVYQVDDAPRYSGSASWVHVDGRHFWESNADAPLPRREYTKRSDYNVLNRNNHQEIFEWGWLHNQDNKKVVRADGKKDEVLVQEKGIEYYKKVEDGKCLAAQNYWKEYAPLWSSVRKTWDERLSKNTDLQVTPNVDDTHLYMKIWDLKPTQTKEAQEHVKSYIVK